MVLDDNSRMPWGVFEGLAMANVPAGYLLSMYEKNKVCKDVRAYVEDNMDVLKQQVKQAKRR